MNNQSFYEYITDYGIVSTFIRKVPHNVAKGTIHIISIRHLGSSFRRFGFSIRHTCLSFPRYALLPLSTPIKVKNTHKVSVSSSII